MCRRLGISHPFFADNAAFDGLERRSTYLLKLLLERGAGRGYFPDPDKSLFISKWNHQEEAEKQEF